MRRILQGHDVLVLPSLEEGFSNVALEAMESAMPIIVTRTGGIDNYINDEVGWAISMADTNAIKDALEAAEKKSLDELMTMGQKTRRLVENAFDIEVLAQKHLNLFKELRYKSQVKYRG